MEELTQFVSKSFEDGNGGSSGEGWGAASSRSSVSPLVDPEDSRSEPPSSPAITRNTSPPPQAGRGTPGELNCDVMAKTEENCEENLIALVQEEPLDLSIKRESHVIDHSYASMEPSTLTKGARLREESSLRRLALCQPTASEVPITSQTRHKIVLGAAANVSPAPDQMKSNYENKINLRSKINSQKEKRSGMPPKKLKQQSKEPNARTTRDNTEASGTPMSVFQSQDFRTCTCLYCCILRLQLLNNFQPF